MITKVMPTHIVHSVLQKYIQHIRLRICLNISSALLITSVCGVCSHGDNDPLGFGFCFHADDFLVLVMPPSLVYPRAPVNKKTTKII